MNRIQFTFLLFYFCFLSQIIGATDVFVKHGELSKLKEIEISIGSDVKTIPKGKTVRFKNVDLEYSNISIPSLSGFLKSIPRLATNLKRAVKGRKMKLDKFSFRQPYLCPFNRDLVESLEITIKGKGRKVNIESFCVLKGVEKEDNEILNRAALAVDFSSDLSGEYEKMVRSGLSYEEWIPQKKLEMLIRLRRKLTHLGKKYKSNELLFADIEALTKTFRLFIDRYEEMIAEIFEFNERFNDLSRNVVTEHGRILSAWELEQVDGLGRLLRKHLSKIRNTITDFEDLVERIKVTGKELYRKDRYFSLYQKLMMAKIEKRIAQFEKMKNRAAFMLKGLLGDFELLTK